MLTSRAWIISSGFVGAISLMLRSALSFSVAGSNFYLPTFNPLFIIINVIIFALAASSSIFGQGSDSSATTEHDHDHGTYHHYEHDDHNHNHSQNHDRSWNNSSSDYSFDQYNKKVQEVKKSPVKSEKSERGGPSSTRGPVSSPEIYFPSKAPEKPTGLRRPPTIPLKTFPQDHKSGDENETMDEMWKRVKAEKQPTKPNTVQGLTSRNDSRMSTSSYPSPSLARRSPPSSSSSGSGKKLMGRIPSWVNLKKELSMGRDELNSRVEAFIRKFNDEMKLQRLESLRRYKLFRRRSEDE